MKKTFLYSLLMIGVIFLSCNDDKDEKTIYPLTFVKDSYEVRLGLSALITIRSGNQHYTITVEDEDILKASPLIAEGSSSSGEVQIYGKKKGETTILVTDNLSGDKVKLKIKVTDTYIGNKLSNSDHPLFIGSYCLYLIKNENKNFYIYSINQTQDKLSLVTEGNYTFSLENNTPFLTFNYKDITNKDVTTKFDLVETPSSTLTFLNSFYALGWYSEQKSLKMTSPPVYTLILKDENNKKSNFSLAPSLEMPEGILD